VTAETNGARSSQTAPRDPEQIERDIARTREELAATVAAVAEKADVKAQARHRVDEAKARVSNRGRAAAANARDNQVAFAAGGAALLIVAALTIWLRRR
jgi:Protein of unknown function (DUF3618)